MFKNVVVLVLSLSLFCLVGLVGCGQGGGTEEQSVATTSTTMTTITTILLTSSSTTSTTIMSRKTISGIVRSFYDASEVVPSAIVYAGGVVIRSGDDGVYHLSGVDLTAETISAVLPDYVATTIPLIDDDVSIPLIHSSEVYFSLYVPERTQVNGRLIDESGAPVSVAVSCTFWADNYFNVYTSNSNSSGEFSFSIHMLENLNLYDGYLSAVNETGGVYKGKFKRVVLERGITLEVGDIVLDGSVTTVSGDIFVPDEYNLSLVECGIQVSPTTYIPLLRTYDLDEPIASSYSFYVPTSSEETYYIRAIATKGDFWSDVTSKYVIDLSLAEDSYTYDLSLPAGFSVVSPIPDQVGVSNIPKFEWASLGDDYIYLIWLGNDYDDIKWQGFTDKTYLEYPLYPLGSGGEIVNLEDGQEYFWIIMGINLSEIDLSDINVADFSSYTEHVYKTDMRFTVGEISASGVSSFGVKKGQGFKMHAEKFLREMGIRERIQKIR